MENFLLVRQDAYNLGKVFNVKDVIKEQVAGLSRREMNAQKVRDGGSKKNIF